MVRAVKTAATIKRIFGRKICDDNKGKDYSHSSAFQNTDG